MKIALVDDEQECINEMSSLCASFGQSTGYHVEIFPFDSGETFLDSFNNVSFDLVFMDIYMKGIDGIAAAMEMRQQNSKCLLVFLTSSMEFMPDAFSCHAFEYVIKPFSKKRIFHVLSDAVKVLPQEQKYIELTINRKTVRIFLDKIVSIITDAHYLDITLANKEKLHCRMTMTEFIEKTNGDTRFLPINKGISVNAEYIQSFENGCCVMESGVSFPLRVRDSENIKKSAMNYNFSKIRSHQRHNRED